MKKIILVIAFCSLISKTFAQQDPQYTQYMYNMGIINPAYATETPAMIHLGSMYSTQWVGVEGAPKTLSLFGQAPTGKNIELGFSIVSDDIGEGIKKENHFSANVAYVLQLNEKHRVSLGIKAGFTSFQTDFSGFRLGDENAHDQLLSENINTTSANIGTGLFYFTDQYYIGVSVPNFMPSKYLYNKEDALGVRTQAAHFYLTGGYIYQINSELKLKPSFMVKTAEHTPLTVDLSANVLFNERFEMGLSHRFNESVSVLANVEVAPNLRIGYAYNYITSNLSRFTSGSHEIILLFDLDLLQLSRKYDKSSRFF